MARWTTSFSEEKHLARINRDIPVLGKVRIILKNGQLVEGVLCGHQVGNNAGQGGWQYYGTCEVMVENGYRVLGDYLDIEDFIEIP